jgi:cysteinyl-tRNA synthetase
MTQEIIQQGYGYVVNGTVYFDVEKYNQEQPYGILTNRKLEDLLEGTRVLGGQDEKKGRLDFALWIKAKPEHLMQWPSPWGRGFPGWHIECSAMSKKYLGNTFDIHGGGMDLAATHHTNEIAQSQACHHTVPVRYWLHTNMLTVNGVRMSKSAGNGFLPEELFTGNHPLLEKAYSPMTVKFFMLQTHYRSTLDFSNEALQAAEKGLKRLWEAYLFLQQLTTTMTTSTDVALDEKIHHLLAAIDQAMNDDCNTAKALANIFELVPVINAIKDGQIPRQALAQTTLQLLQEYFKNYIENIFGLTNEIVKKDSILSGVLQVLAGIRKQAKDNKDYVTSDNIRNELQKLGIVIKDEKNGTTTVAFA